METMKGLFGYDIPIDGPIKERPPAWGPKSNPMIALFGPCKDPDRKCKDCESLFYKQFARKYYKCWWRGNTNGQATDHRKHWSACEKFVEKIKGINNEIL